MNHSKKASFGIELIGMINIIALIAVIIIDYKIIKPVLENRVLKVGTDWRQMDELTSMNLKEFNQYTNFKLIIEAYQEENQLSCEDMEAIIRSPDRSKTYLQCTELGPKEVQFFVPNNIEKDAKMF